MSLLMTQAYEGNDLRSTSYDTSDGPVDGSGDVRQGHGHVRGVGRDVLRRQLLELDDALGDIHHCLDEVVEGIEPRLEGLGVLENVRQLLEERHRLRQRIDCVKLGSQPELPVAHSKRRQRYHYFCIPRVV